MRNDSNEAERGKEDSGELVIARGDAAEILQPSEAARDDVAVLVGALVVPDALLAAGFARDDRLDFWWRETHRYHLLLVLAIPCRFCLFCEERPVRVAART